MSGTLQEDVYTFMITPGRIILRMTTVLEYRIIRKSLRDFRRLRCSSRDGHAEGEHVSRGRDTQSFCPTLQVLDISTLGDASPRLYISSTCKIGQKLGVSLPLLTCSPSAWPSRLLYRRGRKSRTDLRIILYSYKENENIHFMYSIFFRKFLQMS